MMLCSRQQEFKVQEARVLYIVQDFAYNFDYIYDAS